MIPIGAKAAGIEETVQLCAACHGEHGVPQEKTTPVIWGQRAGYIYIQLRDFKRGTRVNEQMAAIVAGLEPAEMKELAEFFSQQSWPNLGQPAAPREVAAQADRIATSGQCTQCHLGGYPGDGTNPRLAGQSLDYLRRTMAAFRSGERANNPWMTDLLKTFSDDDLAAFARFVAGL
jgi:cytochrome c553